MKAKYIRCPIPGYVRYRGLERTTYYKVSEDGVVKLIVFHPKDQISHAEVTEKPGRYENVIGIAISPQEFDQMYSMFDFK